MFVQVDSGVIEKRPEESFYIGVEFKNVLSSGEYIPQDNVTITSYKKSDLSIYSPIVDQSTIRVDNNSLVVFRIQGGEEGKWYLVNVSVETNLGNKFTSVREIKVVGH